MLIVPLASTPSQTLDVTLAGQACTIDVYQKFFGVFCDVLVDQKPIIRGTLCLNQNFLVRSLYLGFVGDFAFFDTQGSSDPSFQGLGTRFLLAYIEQSELPPNYGLST